MTIISLTSRVYHRHIISQLSSLSPRSRMLSSFPPPPLPPIFVPHARLCMLWCHPSCILDQGLLFAPLELWSTWDHDLRRIVFSPSGCLCIFSRSSRVALSSCLHFV